MSGVSRGCLSRCRGWYGARTAIHRKRASGVVALVDASWTGGLRRVWVHGQEECAERSPAPRFTPRRHETCKEPLATHRSRATIPGLVVPP